LEERPSNHESITTPSADGNTIPAHRTKSRKNSSAKPLTRKTITNRPASYSLVIFNTLLL
jgi:hypothetical protein